MNIYLASRSPRRRELLAQLGVRFDVVDVAVDETTLPGETAESHVQRLALAKAEAGWARVRGTRPAPVLGADTEVVIDGEVLGKPADLAHFTGMFGRLSGRTHRVLSAVALVTDGHARALLCESHVTFRPVAADEIIAYWRTGEPSDKAGGYGIQGLGAIFVARLEGSYSGVMGLPLFETAALLREFGCPPLAGVTVT